MTPASVSPTVDKELSLAEMLADPIVIAVMARDGVTRQDMEGMIVSVRDRLAGRRSEDHDIGTRSFDTVAFGGCQGQRRMSSPD